MTLHEELTKRGAKVGDFVIFEKAVGIITNSVGQEEKETLFISLIGLAEYSGWSSWDEPIEFKAFHHFSKTGPFKALMRPQDDFYCSKGWLYRARDLEVWEFNKVQPCPKKKITIEFSPEDREVTIDGVVYERREK